MLTLTTRTVPSASIPICIGLTVLSDMHGDRLQLMAIDAPVRPDPIDAKCPAAATLSALKGAKVGSRWLGRYLMAEKESVGSHANTDDDHVENDGDDRGHLEN